jgi:hypothetical protein
MKRDVLYKYQNGNGVVRLFSSGSRMISFEGNEFKPSFPLNVDVRTSTTCSFGKGSKDSQMCPFCHESAVIRGEDCDYNELYTVLRNLPDGVEIAIGANDLTESYIKFVTRLSKHYPVNITINSGHLYKQHSNLNHLIDNHIVRGVGVSYRSSAAARHLRLINNRTNVVVHAIAGINTVEEVLAIDHNKILILGEKDFGFNKGNVDITTSRHISWQESLPKLLTAFDVVSFDNLAIKQLDVKSHLSKANWKKFYQAEHSLYVDGPAKVFRKSSTSDDSVSYTSMSILEYFNKHRVER